MGEIKSTLDLVMEKTKHLSLSKTEKEVQQKTVIKKTLKGLVQKFKDQLLKPEMFTKELMALEKKYDMTDRNVLVDVILDQMDLEQENTQLLILLKDLCGKDASRFESVLEDFANELTGAKDNRSEEIKRYLSHKHAISGSAVIPNLDADTGWLKTSEKIHKAYEKNLTKEKSHLQSL